MNTVCVSNKFKVLGQINSKLKKKNYLNFNNRLTL